MAARGVLVVPSDIPHLSPDAIAAGRRTRSAPSGSLAVIAATDDGGTNLLACRPANALPLCFGPRSFQQPLRRGARARHECFACLPPGDLGLDIDRPENLDAFLALKSNTRTHAYLAALAISGSFAEERLAALAIFPTTET